MLPGERLHSWEMLRLQLGWVSSLGLLIWGSAQVTPLLGLLIVSTRLRGWPPRGGGGSARACGVWVGKVITEGLSEEVILS